MLQKAFRDVGTPGGPVTRDYDLVGKDREIILSRVWEMVVRAGDSITQQSR